MTRMLLANCTSLSAPLVRALLVLCLTLGHAESFYYSKCDITDNFQSDLISASFTCLEPGWGCETNATSTSGQEVHVIMVSPTVPHTVPWVTVRLGIHSQKRSKQPEAEGLHLSKDLKPVIFVLQSSHRVRWKVSMLGVNSRGKHLFVVSKDSLIRFHKKRTRQMVKIQKPDLPEFSDNSTILEWALEHFGGVTSYSSVADLNIRFYVGRVLNSSASCDISPRIFSYRETTKSITGCVSKRSNHVHAKPVYIIELLEPPEASPGVSGVDLEILPFHDGPNLRSKGEDWKDQDWYFYLVIKSPANLKWSLHSTKLSGTVDIVADASAEVKTVGINIGTVALRADDIKATGRQLVEWSQDYIAPVQMYAGIHAANTIKLRVPSFVDRFSSTLGTATTESKKPEPKRQRAGALVNDPSIRRYDPLENYASLIFVTCTDKIMEVTISKKLFKTNTLDISKVTLKDLNCAPTSETDDFLVLCTELMACGTNSQILDNVTIFTNLVILQASPNLTKDMSSLDMMSTIDQGSGFKEDSTPSESEDFSLLTDDEDIRLFPVTFPVTCQVPSYSEAKDTKKISKNITQSKQCKSKKQTEEPKCTVDVYRSDSFENRVTNMPIVVIDSRVFYAKVSTSYNVSLLVEACWLSQSAIPSDNSATVLISDGCSNEASVSWLSDSANVTSENNIQESRFRMEVRGQPVTYLHCLFQACQMGSGTAENECFVSHEEGCQPFSRQQFSGSEREIEPLPFCGPLTVGPFILPHNFSPHKLMPVSKSEGSSENKTSRFSGRQQRVIIEGLDSATVVAISFAAFVIGVLLMGSLWFIHSRTGPIKRAVRSTVEPETGDDITQNSSAQMTA